MNQTAFPPDVDVERRLLDAAIAEARAGMLREVARLNRKIADLPARERSGGFP